MNDVSEQPAPNAISPNGHSDSESEPLKVYTQHKFALAAQLRSLREILNERGNEPRGEQCQELMAKLAEDRFTLAVVGQFKRGKSSLMNAIIGHEVLPVGILPLTSAITVLRFGPKERLLIRRESEHLPFDEVFPVSKLAEFVTEEGNPGNGQHIKTATIEIPLPFLRRGLEFVDTPGIGSAIEANTKTTLNFLPECDAVIFVTSVESPFSRAELDLLETIRQHVHKIFFVVNKIDLLAAQERQEVLDFVRRSICKQMDADSIRLFPVSARLGLESKVDGNWKLGLESGLRELENELVRFLSTEKTSLFLGAIIRRSLWLLDQESFEISLNVHANELSGKVLAERLGELEARLEGRKIERLQIFDLLRQQILSQVEVTLMPELLTIIRSEINNFISDVGDLLCRLTWCPLRTAWEKAAEAASIRVCKNIQQRLSEQIDKFGFESDEVASTEWQRIQQNIANLPTVAGETIGLGGHVNHEGEMLPPWHLKVKFETPFALNLNHLLHGPASLKILPVFLTRKWLVEHLRTQHKEMETKWREATIVYVANNVLKAIDALLNDAEKQASEIGLRVKTSFQNGRPQEEVEKNLQTFDGIRRQLLALWEEILPTQPLPEGRPAALGAFTLRSREDSAPASFKSMESLKINFAADLKTRNCAVCNYLSRVTFHFLANFQWDIIRNQATQQTFATELGFCPLHTWQLEAVSSPLGASIGLVQLAEHLSKILGEKERSFADGRSDREPLLKPESCRVCRLLNAAEQDYLQKLTKFVNEQDGRSIYVSSQGVCLRHLDLWLPSLNNESAQFVLRRASACFEEMAENMQSFSLKTGAIRRGLNNIDEDDAYLRTIVHLVGTRGNCMPPSKEAEI
jgi:GTP-binding protein EngB required for normal cell division